MRKQSINFGSSEIGVRVGPCCIFCIIQIDNPNAHRNTDIGGRGEWCLQSQAYHKHYGIFLRSKISKSQFSFKCPTESHHWYGSWYRSLNNEKKKYIIKWDHPVLLGHLSVTRESTTTIYIPWIIHTGDLGETSRF